MKSPTNVSLEPLVTVAEIARLLGVPRSFVYERTARGDIPCYRVGRLLRFRVSEVERWVADGGSAPRGTRE